MNEKPKNKGRVSLVGISILIAIFCSGCDSKELQDLEDDTLQVKLVGRVEIGEIATNNDSVLYEFTHESCEYLYIRGIERSGIAHKGNCANPVHFHNK